MNWNVEFLRISPHFSACPFAVAWLLCWAEKILAKYFLRAAGPWGPESLMNNWSKKKHFSNVYVHKEPLGRMLSVLRTTLNNHHPSSFVRPIPKIHQLAQPTMVQIWLKLTPIITSPLSHSWRSPWASHCGAEQSRVQCGRTECSGTEHYGASMASEWPCPQIIFFGHFLAAG